MANDKPLLVIFEDRLYFPVFETVPVSEYGGEFTTEAEYRDDYVRELIENKGSIYWPLIRYSYDTINYNYLHQHLLFQLKKTGLVQMIRVVT